MLGQMRSQRRGQDAFGSADTQVLAVTPHLHALASQFGDELGRLCVWSGLQSSTSSQSCSQGSDRWARNKVSIEPVDSFSSSASLFGRKSVYSAIPNTGGEASEERDNSSRASVAKSAGVEPSSSFDSGMVTLRFLSMRFLISSAINESIPNLLSG